MLEWGLQVPPPGASSCSWGAGDSRGRGCESHLQEKATLFLTVHALGLPSGPFHDVPLPACHSCLSLLPVTGSQLLGLPPASP